MVIDFGKLQSANPWKWYLKFAWLPARMDSGVNIWWKEYYHGTRLVFKQVDQEPILLHQYMTIEEFTWRSLQQS